MTSPGAIERLLPLLKPELRDGIDTSQGYVDVLARDLDQPGLVGELMQAGALSRIYERWWRPAWGRVAKGLSGPGMAEEKRIARLLMGLGPGDGLLDVACGPANFTRDFARAVGDDGLALGLDGSRPMLVQAVRHSHEEGLANIAFVHGDATALPFRDASFDAVCCFAALNLFAEPFAALDEMRRVLSRNGRIALFTSARTELGPMRLFETTLARPAGIRMFGRDEIVEALRVRGFTDIRQRISGLTQFVGGRLPAAVVKTM